MKHMIADNVLERAPAIRNDFLTAKPFRHACVEDFLEPRWAETLLAEFPVFDPNKAVDEFGKIGRKAVRTDMREISDRYREFFDYISSQPFLDAVSAMTGIPDLLFDTQMYGGGTHENLEGQALDAHVDFNYDQDRKLHRRINLLIYLNKEWDVSWGGAIQLHSDPRDWVHDQVKTFNCNFNRCLMFETNEHSWHGFEQIRLPAEKHGLTRKCISIYLYTRERPAEEIVPVHGTFYVQRSLPGHYVAGHRLVAADLTELRQLVTQRDDWIAFYQRLERNLGDETRALRAYAGDLAVYNRIEGLAIKLPKHAYLMGPLRNCIALYLRLKKMLTDHPTTPADVALRAFPSLLTAGRVLDAADIDELTRLLMERDALIKAYQQKELDFRREHEVLHGRISALLGSILLPVGGGLRQEPGAIQGACGGGWIAPRLVLRLRAASPLRALCVEGWIPSTYPTGMRIEGRIGDRLAAAATPVPGRRFELRLQPGEPLQGGFTVEVSTTSPVPVPKQENDRRDLAFWLWQVRGLR